MRAVGRRTQKAAIGLLILSLSKDEEAGSAIPLAAPA